MMPTALLLLFASCRTLRPLLEITWWQLLGIYASRYSPGFVSLRSWVWFVSIANAGATKTVALNNNDLVKLVYFCQLAFCFITLSVFNCLCQHLISNFYLGHLLKAWIKHHSQDIKKIYLLLCLLHFQVRSRVIKHKRAVCDRPQHQSLPLPNSAKSHSSTQLIAYVHTAHFTDMGSLLKYFLRAGLLK